MGQRFVGRVEKDPDEILDYTEDWTDVLTPIDDQIKDCAFAVTGSLIIDQSQFSLYDSTITVGGGTVGVKDAASMTITTMAGRKFKRSIRVNGIQR